MTASRISSSNDGDSFSLSSEEFKEQKTDASAAEKQEKEASGVDDQSDNGIQESRWPSCRQTLRYVCCKSSCCCSEETYKERCDLCFDCGSNLVLPSVGIATKIVEAYLSQVDYDESKTKIVDLVCNKIDTTNGLECKDILGQHHDQLVNRLGLSFKIFISYTPL